MDDLLKLEISDLQSISESKSIHKVPLPLDCAADDLLTTPRRLLALATCAHCSRERSHGRPHRLAQSSRPAARERAAAGREGRARRRV